jgi:hypothetical protein
MSDMYEYIHSAIFKLTRTQKQKWKRKQTWKWKWTWKRKRKLYLIRRNSSYSTMRIVANMSTAQFLMALCTCSASLWWKDWHKIVHRHWNYSLNDVLAELERSIWGFKKKAATRGKYSKWNWLVIFQFLYEVALTFKGPLTWEGMVKTNCKSQRLSL